VTPDPLRYPLFVYGTLLSGCRSAEAERLLAGARLVGQASLRGFLYRVAAYPGLLLAEAAAPVTGELYQLVSPAQLAALDAWENATPAGSSAAEYLRSLVTVESKSGAIQQAWVYLYNRPVAGLARLSTWPASAMD
jgi:gamma-glutamylcyclotransferase (GGCT)/AIG2-like uncharacterized protein YtfP